MIANIGPTFAQSPSNVSANLVLWLKANQGVYTDVNPSDGNLAGTTLATDGQSSQSWDDVSGARAHDATRTTAFASDLSGLSWGNNNGDVTNFVSADFPVVGNNRWARVWYAQNVNFNSTVNIQFTDSNIEDGITYYLISETDGDGNFGSSDDGVVENGGVGVVATGNTVSFAGVNLNNKFFTLALKIEANYMRHGKFFPKRQ